MSLTCADAARIMRVRPSTVRRLVLQGRLPAGRHGNMWVIEAEDLAEFALKDRRPYWWTREQERQSQGLDTGAATR